MCSRVYVLYPGGTCGDFSDRTFAGDLVFFCRASFGGVSNIRQSANSKHLISMSERVRPGISKSSGDLANSSV